MSDWDIVKQFVSERSYTPKYVTIDDYIAIIILHYELDLESENLTEKELSLMQWLKTYLDMNYRMESFDYE